MSTESTNPVAEPKLVHCRQLADLLQVLSFVHGPRELFPRQVMAQCQGGPFAVTVPANRVADLEHLSAQRGWNLSFDGAASGQLVPLADLVHWGLQSVDVNAEALHRLGPFPEQGYVL